MEQQAASLASVAVKNPLFRDQMKKKAFEAVDSEEHDNELWNKNAAIPVDPTQLDVTERELAEMRALSRKLKLFMIGTAALMIVTAWYNIGTGSDLGSTFLAMYLFFFSTLICCFELAIRRMATLIVQNFGFMYNAAGKVIFLCFVAFMCFEMSALGKACFALIACYCFATLYVHYKHPQYARYQRLMHFYNKARAGKASVNNNTSVV